MPMKAVSSAICADSRSTSSHGPVAPTSHGRRAASRKHSVDAATLIHAPARQEATSPRTIAPAKALIGTKAAGVRTSSGFIGARRRSRPAG